MAGKPSRGPIGGRVSPGRSSPDRVDEISLVRLLNVFLRHRWIVLGLPVLVAVGVVAVTLLLPRTYTAEAAFLPEAAAQDPSRLTDLAAQFGFEVPRGQTGETPDFYADLLRSYGLLKAVVATPYRIDAARGDGVGGRMTLLAYYALEDEPRAVAREMAVDRLRGDVRVLTRQETGVVEFSVTTRHSHLSRRVAARMLELVNEFNLERRQSQAAAERIFVEERLRKAEDELLAAEDSFQGFLERNRRYENDPELAFRADRLQRRVDLRQQVVSSLSQSYEQARIEEVRNTPVVTVVNPPEAPARPDSRQVPIKAVLGLMVGGVLGVFWAFGREFLTAAREADPDDYQEFERLRAETRAELGTAWRRLRRALSGAGRRET